MNRKNRSNSIVNRRRGPVVVPPPAPSKPMKRVEDVKILTAKQVRPPTYNQATAISDTFEKAWEKVQNKLDAMGASADAEYFKENFDTWFSNAVRDGVISAEEAANGLAVLSSAIYDILETIASMGEVIADEGGRASAGDKASIASVEDLRRELLKFGQLPSGSAATDFGKGVLHLGDYAIPVGALISSMIMDRTQKVVAPVPKGSDFTKHFSSDRRELLNYEKVASWRYAFGEVGDNRTITWTLPAHVTHMSVWQLVPGTAFLTLTQRYYTRAELGIDEGAQTVIVKSATLGSGSVQLTFPKGAVVLIADIETSSASTPIEFVAITPYAFTHDLKAAASLGLGIAGFAAENKWGAFLFMLSPGLEKVLETPTAAGVGSIIRGLGATSLIGA